MSAVAASQMYGGTCRCNALCCTRLSGSESGRDTPCSAGIVLSDQRICHSQTIRPRTCVPPALPRPPVCHRQGRTADIISVRRGCPLTAVVTVQMLLYHVCNRFARLFHRFFPFFIEKVQLEIQKIRQFCARNTKKSVDFTRESPFSQQFPVLSESSFFQNSPLILETRMRIYRILLVPETIPCYNKKSICGDNKPTLLFYVLAFYPFSLMPAVFSALPVGKVWRKQQLQMHQKQSIINIISGINDAGAASPAGNSRTAILGFIFSCIEERRKNLWRKNNSRKKRN